MGMLLKRQDDPEYPLIDDNGVSWRSDSEWLWGSILGGCGCGSSETFGNKVLELLTYFSTEHAERSRLIVDPYENLTDEVISHWMDSKGLLEHGTSIGSSWLSEKGKEILAAIKSL